MDDIFNPNVDSIFIYYLWSRPNNFSKNHPVNTSFKTFWLQYKLNMSRTFFLSKSWSERIHMCFCNENCFFWIQNSYQFENSKPCFIVEKTLRKWKLLKNVTIWKLKTWFYRWKTYYFAFCAANRLLSSSFVSSTLRDSPPLVNPFQMQYPFKAHGSLSADVLW